MFACEVLGLGRSHLGLCCAPQDLSFCFTLGHGDPEYMMVSLAQLYTTAAKRGVARRL